MKIIDCHVHLASNKCIPRGFIHGVAQNMAADAPREVQRITVSGIASMLDHQLNDHDGDRLIDEMDEAGIDKSVLLLPDFTIALSSSVTIEEMAVIHHRVRQRHPGRFYVFQGIDPRRGKGALEFLKAVVAEYGFEGVKLYPPCGYSPSDPGLFPIYEFCQERGLPVLTHTGPTSPTLGFEQARAGLIDTAAQKFPGVNFILAHAGAGISSEGISICRFRPNVYMDISAFQIAMNPRGWRAHLSDLLALGLNHKILFGTDWPLFRMMGSQKKFVHDLAGDGGVLRNLPQTDMHKILCGNLERILPAGGA